MPARHRIVAIGAGCALLAFLPGLGPELIAADWRAGVVGLTLLRPLLLGAMTGYLYARAVGDDASGDDPDSLAVFTPAERATGESVVSTVTSRYYDGPVQVPLSVAASAIAALAGAIVTVGCAACGLLIAAAQPGTPPPLAMRGITLLGDVPGGDPALRAWRSSDCRT